MANYNIDIAVALKGAKELVKLKKDVKAVNQEIRGFNKALAENANKFPKTINKLAEEVNKAKVALRNAAVGTNTFTRAGEVLLKTQKALNKELSEEARILKQIETRRFGVAQSSSSNRVRRNVAESSKTRIDPKFKSLSLLGQTSPVAGRIERNITLKQDEIKLQEALLSLEIKSAAVQNKKLEITGELNRQTVQAVNAAKINALGGRGVGAGQAQSVFKDRVLSNIASSQEIREIVAAGSNRAKMGGGFKEFNKNAKKIQADTKKMSQILSQQQAGSLTNAAAGINQFSRPIGPVRPGMLGRLGIGTGANPQGMFANSRGRAGRLSGALSSGLIGGGFPLLFGQGALGAAGGGIGGVAGGALGGPFGFGLSIAGTAIAQRIQESIDFRKSVSELNKEMEQMGLSSNISARGVIQLGKSLGITKQEAMKALQQFKRFGDNALLFARSFGGDFAKFDALSQANTVESALSAIRKINKDLTLEDELKLILSIKRKGVEATINDLITDTLEKQKELDTKDFKKTEGSTRIRPGVLRRQSNELKTINERNTKTVEELTKVRDLQDQIRIASEEASFSIVKGLQDVNSEIRRLNNAQFQIVELSKTLGSSFSESFKGIIKGTMSVQSAFANMFSRIADHYLDMAAQMAAASITKGFLGMFASAFGPKTFTSPNPTPTLTSEQQVSRFTFGKADGGSVKGGNSYIVGERGPELFSPGVSGMITPNEMLGGSTNIVVNVDASGSSVEGDEQQGRELGKLISVAIQSELVKQKRPGGLLG